MSLLVTGPTTKKGMKVSLKMNESGMKVALVLKLWGQLTETQTLSRMKVE